MSHIEHLINRSKTSAERLCSGTIYAIFNRLSQKVYVGQSTQPKVRRTQHFSMLRRRKHKNPRLQADFTLHGEDNFVFATLQEDVPLCRLTELENYYLERYRPSPGGVYNAWGPAESPNLGHSISEETREKMRAAYSRVPGQWKHSEETRRRLSANGHISSSQRARMDEGRRTSERFREHLRTLHASMRGKSKPLSDLQRRVLSERTRRIRRIAPDGDVVEYTSAVSASKEGFNLSKIYAVCRGDRTQHKHFRWEYV